MKIKLIKPWGMASIGEIIDPPIGVASLLIERKIAIIPDDRNINDDWNKRLKQPPPAKTRDLRGTRGR